MATNPPPKLDVFLREIEPTRRALEDQCRKHGIPALLVFELGSKPTALVQYIIPDANGTVDKTLHDTYLLIEQRSRGTPPTTPPGDSTP